MITIPVDKQGELVVSALAIAAALLKVVSDRAKNKVDAEPECPNPPENEVEVISKKDFDNLIAQVTQSADSIQKARDSFEDTLACITIINILLQVLASDPKKDLIRTAEQQVYAFVRHTDFPSRMMLTTIFEAVIKEIQDSIDKKESENKE